MNHVCFAAPPQQISTYVLQLAEYILILFFRKKFDENRKTLPFSSLVSTGVKGEIRLVFKPFDFVFTN